MPWRFGFVPIYKPNAIAEPIMPAAAQKSPSIPLSLDAPEVFVAVGAAEVDEGAPAAVDEAALGTADRTGSVVNVAVRPVAFVHVDGVEGAGPLMNLTAAHCHVSTQWHINLNQASHLIEETVNCILNNLKKSIGSCPRVG